MTAHPRPWSTSLAAQVPDGWFVKESVTLLSPDGQANVICSSEPLDPTIDVWHYAAVQGDLLRHELPHYSEGESGPTTVFGDRVGFVRRFSWKPPDGVARRQIQLYYAEPGRGFTATATTPSTQLDGFLQVFEQILTGLRLVGGAADAPPRRRWFDRDSRKPVLRTSR